jgi:hypothetical protein
MINFRYPIPHLDPAQIKTQSQAGQDLFVVAMLQGRTNGTFLEIGAGHPQSMSNCWLLEKQFQFTGYSIDRTDRVSWLPPYSWPEQRPNSKFMLSLAQDVDYGAMPDYFDYLQIDLDDTHTTWQVLKLLRNKKFAVITFEHDYWRKQPENIQLMNESRDYFAEQGYRLVVNNVTIQPGRGYGLGDEPIFFEDWYVHPDFVPAEVIESYTWVDDGSTIKYFPDILFTNTQ